MRIVRLETLRKPPRICPYRTRIDGNRSKLRNLAVARSAFDFCKLLFYIR